MQRQAPIALEPDTPTCHARERRERLAACAIYAGPGLLAGTSSARIPAVRQQLGIGAPELGVALFGSGLGILVGIALATPLSWRIATRRWVIGGCAGYGATFAVVGSARSVAVLFVALLVGGVASGLLTAQQNLVGAGLERAHGRPVMSLVFGVQSAGVLAGGASGAVATAMGLSPAAHFGLLALVVATSSVVAGRWLVHRAPDPAPESSVRVHRQMLPQTPIWLLALMAFVAVLAFGTTMDWSALYVSRDLGGTHAVAAVAPTVFVGLLSVGRLAGNAAAGRYGETSTLRAGLGLASGGMVVVATAASPGAALVGLSLGGVGLSCMLPLVTAAAGRLVPDRPAATMGVVTAAACTSYLVGPPVVGLVAARVGLAVVFVGVAVLLGVSGMLAGRALRACSGSAARGDDAVRRGMTWSNRFVQRDVPDVVDRCRRKHVGDRAVLDSGRRLQHRRATAERGRVLDLDVRR
jgi:MFS family permease